MTGVADPPSSAPPSPGRRRRARPPVPREFAHLPALDGLRALAVLAVVLYHADVVLVGGGFLGVEVFLVISGYLIASLLLHQRDVSGGIALRRFWLGRVRRLVPAVAVLVLGCIAAAAVFAPDALRQLRTDLPGAVLYVSNWTQILHDESYFLAAGRPPLLRHLWSLAVEVQFYAVFPFVMAVAGARLRRRHLFVGAGLGAVASALLMAALYHPSADPSRVFFGTDTRASGLLVGVALAAIWPAQRFRPTRVPAAAQRTLDITGGLALVILVGTFLWVNEFDPFVYRGGFLLVDLATMVLIAAAVHPAGRLVGMLGIRPLAWIGQRSYSLYLWHWPVIVLTRPDLDVDIHGTALLILRLVLSFALAELSYRFVEAPFRSGALGRVVGAYRRPSSPQERLRARWFVGFASAALATSAVITAWPDLPDADSGLADQPTEVIDVAPTAAPTTAVVSTTADPTAPITPPTTAAPTTTTIPVGVLAVGDSVMAGAVDPMRTLIGSLTVNAKISRACGEAVRIVRASLADGSLPQTVVVHMGTNGPCTETELDDLVALTADRRLVLVDVAAPRPWEHLANERIAAAVARAPGVGLADWKSRSDGHPEWFVADGVHLTPAGRLAYAALVSEAIG